MSPAPLAMSPGAVAMSPALPLAMSAGPAMSAGGPPPPPPPPRPGTAGAWGGGPRHVGGRAAPLARRHRLRHRLGAARRVTDVDRERRRRRIGGALPAHRRAEHIHVVAAVAELHVGVPRRVELRI